MQPRTDQTLCRVQGEYLEMPGLSLTTKQAQRLWGLDQKSCEEVLCALVAQRFLRKTTSGTFVRAANAA